MPSVSTQDASASQSLDDRGSLLDTLVKDYEVEKQNRTSRIILTGSLPDHFPFAAQSLLSLHTEFVSSHQTPTSQSESEDNVDVLLKPPVDEYKQLRDRVTGIVLCINGHAFLSVVESSTPSLIAFLKQLQSSFTAAASIKILCFTEESFRDFPNFTHNLNLRQHIQKSDESGLQSSLSEDECLMCVVSVVRSMAEIGRELSSLAASQQLSRVQDYVATLQAASATTQQSANKIALYNKIPTCDKLKQLQELDSDQLFNIEDFLQVYDEPINCVLEDELVHPQEPIWNV